MSLYTLKSPEGEHVGYTKYRERTGLCEGCGEPMESHPRCEACSALSGQDHNIQSYPYRGHNVCGYCHHAWKNLEKLTGRETTWEEFIKPRLAKEDSP